MRCAVPVVLFAVSVAAAACQSTSPAVEPASMVVRGGRIVTVDAATPDVQALAVRGDSIVALGTNEEIEPYVGPDTEVIELAGQFAMPGFIEGHGHFTGLGQSKMNLDLMDVTSWDEIVSMVGTAAKQARPGDWIQGRGWHQEKWSRTPEPNVEGFPLHDALSKVSPDNPVVLTHASGHASYVNASAMQRAGITARTRNPEGGEILKDRRGRPIGVLRETASNLVNRALNEWRAKKTPEERTADARRQIELAIEEALSKGVTSFQDAGANFETVEMYKQFVNDGRMGVRLWVMVRDTNENIRTKMPGARVVNMGDKRLTVAAIKKTIDGALGSRGAWLLEPYSDLAGHTGLNTTPVPEVQEVAEIALEQNVQLCVHAIGDRANRQVLDIYEAAFKTEPDQKDRRWRIEHAQHLHPTDIPRFGQLGVIASMQGVHCTSDAPYVLERLGPVRAEEGAYVWQKLMKSGAVISNGTDTPVERIDPIASYFSTVTRKLKDGSSFYPDQRMSREEGLKSYTWNAAFAAKEETIKGSLAVGKLADITVLSKDILTVPDDEILTARVVYTIVGGRVMYRGQGA
ncbi:MAG: amidohydrolase, partial [Acidobacteria bacterium]|nr:amidohydrolase [Acidobacteriota bacterium]